MPSHPLLRRYDLNEANMLMNGKFHDEELEEEVFDNTQAKDKKVTTMYYSKDEAFDEKNQFEDFESALKKIT